MVKQKKEKRWFMVNQRKDKKYILPFNCNHTSQDKAKARKAPIDEGKGAQSQRYVRCVLITSKTRQLASAKTRKVRMNKGKAYRRKGTQSEQFSRLLKTISKSKLTQFFIPTQQTSICAKSETLEKGVKCIQNSQ